MWDAAGGRRQHPALGQVLPGRDALHPVRHRGSLSLSLGRHLPHDAQGKRRDDSRRDDFLHGDPVRRLPLRGEEAGLRLEKLRWRTANPGSLRLGRREPLYVSPVLLAVALTLLLLPPLIAPLTKAEPKALGIR